MKFSLKVPFIKLLITIIAFLASGNSQSFNEDIIAEVGNRKIIVKDFKEFLKNNIQSCGLIDDLSAVDMKKYLMIFLDYQLLLCEAEENNVENDQIILNNVNNFQKEAIINRLIEYSVIDSIISENKLWDFYDQYGGEIYLKQILVRESDPLVSKILADSIYNELIQGLEFEIAASRFSKDILTSKKEGNLGYVRWGQLSNEVQKVAFELETNEISPPIKTPFGYYIIKVSLKKKCAFEDEIRGIKYQLITNYAKRVENDKKIFFNKLWKKYQVKLYNSNIQQVLDQITVDSTPFQNIPANIKNIHLTIYKDGTIDLNSFIESLGEENFYNRTWNETLLSERIAEIVLNKIAIIEAKKLNLEVKEDVERYKRAEIIRTIKQSYNDNYENFIKELKEKFTVKINETVFNEFIVNPLNYKENSFSRRKD